MDDLLFNESFVRVKDKIYCGRCNLLLDVHACFPRICIFSVLDGMVEFCYKVLAIGDSGYQRCAISVLWAPP